MAETKPAAPGKEPEQLDKYGNSRSEWRAWNWQNQLFEQWKAEDKQVSPDAAEVK